MKLNLLNFDGNCKSNDGDAIGGGSKGDDMTCPDCKGTGRITLFTTSEPCKHCGGRGGYRDPDGILPEILGSPDFKGCSISITRDLLVTEIAKVFAIPAHILGDPSNRTIFEKERERLRKFSVQLS